MPAGCRKLDIGMLPHCETKRSYFHVRPDSKGKGGQAASGSTPKHLTSMWEPSCSRFAYPEILLDEAV